MATQRQLLNRDSQFTSDKPLHMIPNISVLIPQSERPDVSAIVSILYMSDEACHQVKGLNRPCQYSPVEQQYVICIS